METTCGPSPVSWHAWCIRVNAGDTVIPGQNAMHKYWYVTLHPCDFVINTCSWQIIPFAQESMSSLFSSRPCRVQQQPVGAIYPGDHHEQRLNGLNQSDIRLLGSTSCDQLQGWVCLSTSLRTLMCDRLEITRGWNILNSRSLFLVWTTDATSDHLRTS